VVGTDFAKWARSRARDQPQNGFLFDDVTEQVEQHLGQLEREISELESDSTATRTVPETVGACVDGVIDALLVSYQGSLEGSVASKHGAAAKVDEDEYGLVARQVPASHSIFAAWNVKLRALHAEEATRKLQGELASLLPASDGDSQVSIQVGLMLQCMKPLLQAYQHDNSGYALEFLRFHKTLAKLIHILCQTYLGLFQRGFCVPEPEKESSAEDEQKGEAGAGLGEGQGDNNVSKEIDHEDELEGARDEAGRMDSGAGEQPNQKQDGEEDNVSVEEDFNGELGDEPDRGSQDGDDGANKDRNLDEQMGQVDGDKPQEVDEELWNKEEEEEKADGGEEEESKENDEDGETPELSEDQGVQGEVQDESGKPPEGNAEEDRGKQEAGSQDDPGEVVAGEERDDQGSEQSAEEREKESDADGNEVKNPVDEEADEDGQEMEEHDSEDRARDGAADPLPEAVPEEEDALAESMELDRDQGDNQDEGDGGFEDMHLDQKQDAFEEGQEDVDEAEQGLAGAAPSAGADQQEDVPETNETKADNDGTGEVQTGASRSAGDKNQPKERRRNLDVPDPSRSLGDAKESWRRRLQMIDQENKTGESERTHAMGIVSADSVPLPRREQRGRRRLGTGHGRRRCFRTCASGG
jgi:midasin